MQSIIHVLWLCLVMFGVASVCACVNVSCLLSCYWPLGQATGSGDWLARCEMCCDGLMVWLCRCVLFVSLSGVVQQCPTRIYSNNGIGMDWGS